MGRPPIALSPSQIQEVETLAALLSQDQIADYFGIVRNTFRAICERDEEVVARYKKGKAKAIAHVANGLLQKARSGDTVAMLFYLKTQGGWREADRVPPETDDVPPIEIHFHTLQPQAPMRITRGVAEDCVEAYGGGAIMLPSATKGPAGVLGQSKPQICARVSPAGEA